MSGGARAAVAAYVEALPKGLASYSDYQQKGAIFREFLAGLRLRDLAEQLPPELAELVRSPPPVNAWVSEVHAHAVYEAACAAFFSDQDAFVEAAYEHNLRLIEGPLYGILFKLVSPERVLAGGVSRWTKFHRGQRLLIERVASGHAAVRLIAPPGLTTALLARCYGTGFRAALEAAGGTAVTIDVSPSGPGEYRYHASWK